MKKLITILTVLFVMFSANVFAEGTVQQRFDGYSRWGDNVQSATFVIYSDGGSVPETAFKAPSDIMGWYLFSVEMYSSADDAFTVTITTYLGAELFSYTTTAATGGHLENALDRWPITSTPNIDVTNLATTERCTVIVTFVR